MPMTIDELEALRNKSVKADDAISWPAGRILQILVPNPSPSTILPAVLPFSLKDRDRVLAVTPRCEAQWGAANGIAITKVASLAWDVKGDVALRSKRAQELCHNADWVNGPGGWIPFLSKQLRDYNNTNNGCHYEIIRQSEAYGSKILGIGHLSSKACYRTGDPENPIIYRDKIGREHLLKWWQVVSMADLPESDEWFFGAGLCAAERAYSQIIKMSAVERYVYEKVSASRPLAIHIVNGMMSDDFNTLIQDTQDQQAQKGLSSYMGAIIMATLKPDIAPALVTIPLAELPDGFNAEEERARSDLIYANALGLDPQDLRPMSGQQLGAGAQSAVLHEKAKGRGLVSFRQGFVHNMNELVLDDKTKFLFTEKDYDDQEKTAQISSLRADVATKRITAQITSAEQERQLMVDTDELPKWVIPDDQTATETISDTDKPDVDDSTTAGEEASGEVPMAPPATAAAPPPVLPTEHKSLKFKAGKERAPRGFEALRKEQDDIGSSADGIAEHTHRALRRLSRRTRKSAA